MSRRKQPKLPSPATSLEHRILLVRGQRVMLDADLAELYGVEVRQLKQSVRRNIARFPDDFMFELTREEYASLRSQFVILEQRGEVSRSRIATLKRGEHSKYLPFAFTENGVAMLSSVLRSQQAIQVNVEIMRTFTRLRQMAGAVKELAGRIDALERKYDERFAVIFEAIRRLMEPPPDKPKGKIGFRSGKERRPGAKRKPTTPA